MENQKLNQITVYIIVDWAKKLLTRLLIEGNCLDFKASGLNRKNEEVSAGWEYLNTMASVRYFLRRAGK
jgi:hypothetical protein